MLDPQQQEMLKKLASDTDPNRAGAVDQITREVNKNAFSNRLDNQSSGGQSTRLAPGEVKNLIEQFKKAQGTNAGSAAQTGQAAQGIYVRSTPDSRTASTSSGSGRSGIANRVAAFGGRNSTPQQLDGATSGRLAVLIKEGDAAAQGQDYTGALQKYWTAWDLLPEPKTGWDTAVWILAKVADSNFRTHNYATARDNILVALRCPNSQGNSFLHMRLGQCYFELGNRDYAVNELMTAYKGSGRSIFGQEDSKYFQFLTSTANPPPGGW